MLKNPVKNKYIQAGSIDLIKRVKFQAYAGVYEDEVEKCRNDEGYGRKAVVCDPNHLLANKTSQKLSNMLSSLQSRLELD